MKINPRGFSLIEIIIVVIIVGVLSSLAIINFGTVVERAKAKEGEQILFAAFAAVKASLLEGNNLPAINSPLSTVVTYTPSQNFTAYQFTPAPGYVGPPNGMFYYAQIQRNSSYLLSVKISRIINNSVILCEDFDGPPGICNKLGY